jgi:hypothetical protein
VCRGNKVHAISLAAIYHVVESIQAHSDTLAAFIGLEPDGVKEPEIFVNVTGKPAETGGQK